MQVTTQHSTRGSLHPAPAGPLALSATQRSTGVLLLLLLLTLLLL
jgi:hypothetical protein